MYVSILLLRFDEVLVFNLHCVNFHGHKMIFETLKQRILPFDCHKKLYKLAKKCLFPQEYVEKT